MVCCEKKTASLSVWVPVLQKFSYIFFLLLLDLYFLMSITSTHQDSIFVINLSPACLAFWIQKVILDHSVPEQDSVFGYVTAGLWFFYLFIQSNLYVWIWQWFWCCQVAGGATFAVLGSLNRMMDHSTYISLSIVDSWILSETCLEPHL